MSSALASGVARAMTLMSTKLLPIPSRLDWVFIARLDAYNSLMWRPVDYSGHVEQGKIMRVAPVVALPFRGSRQPMHRPPCMCSVSIQVPRRTPFGEPCRLAAGRLRSSRRAHTVACDLFGRDNP